MIARGEQPGSLLWKLADKLVFVKIREAFGGRVKVYISGGAPLGQETTDWFLGVGVGCSRAMG